MSASINNKVIEEIVVSFPRGGNWSVIDISQLCDTGGNISWETAVPLKGQGGVYVWSFPAALFKKELQLKLHGPETMGSVLFVFSAHSLPRIFKNRIVAYVGRASDLYERLCQHLRPSGRTTFQVGKGLVSCRLAKDKRHARELMCQHAYFHYHELPGPENAVNRDLIEAALYSKYRAPFNVKSEH